MSERVKVTKSHIETTALKVIAAHSPVKWFNPKTGDYEYHHDVREALDALSSYNELLDWVKEAVHLLSTLGLEDRGPSDTRGIAHVQKLPEWVKGRV